MAISVVLAFCLFITFVLAFNVINVITARNTKLRVGTYPPQADPPDQAHTPGADTPQTRHPP